MTLKQFKVFVSMMVPNTGYFIIDAETPEEAITKYTADILPKIPPGCKEVKVVDVQDYEDNEQDIPDNVENKVIN